jgi:hypothetical protein
VSLPWLESLPGLQLSVTSVWRQVLGPLASTIGSVTPQSRSNTVVLYQGQYCSPRNFQSHLEAAQKSWQTGRAAGVLWVEAKVAVTMGEVPVMRNNQAQLVHMPRLGTPPHIFTSQGHSWLRNPEQGVSFGLMSQGLRPCPPQGARLVLRPYPHRSRSLMVLTGALRARRGSEASKFPQPECSPAWVQSPGQEPSWAPPSTWVVPRIRASQTRRAWTSASQKQNFCSVLKNTIGVSSPPASSGFGKHFLPQSAYALECQGASSGKRHIWTLNSKAFSAAQQEQLSKACALFFGFPSSQPRALGDWRAAKTMWPNANPKKSARSPSPPCSASCPAHSPQRPNLSRAALSLYLSSQCVIISLPPNPVS